LGQLREARKRKKKERGKEGKGGNVIFDRVRGEWPRLRQRVPLRGDMEINTGTAGRGAKGGEKKRGETSAIC